jgi:hypothetical protein
MGSRDFWAIAGITTIVGGVALALYSLTEEERKAEEEWREKGREVEEEIDRHTREIDSHIKQRQAEYNFYEMRKTYRESVASSSAAYELLKSAKTTLNSINKMIASAKKQKLYLESILENAKKNRDKTLFSKTIQELKDVNVIRRRLFEERDVYQSQRDNLLQKVREINNRTHELKECIRDNCGLLGIEWYQKLQERRLAAGRFS